MGEGSSIPNINGIRTDVIERLKAIGIPNLRWPGGCFADTYNWKDGIGPKESRPSIVNTWWGGVTENNRFGTHDFLNFCELLGAEPFISANVGSGTVRELMEWVQYVNFEGESPMSSLRKVNGREHPWSVKFWGLGNEAWGCGGNMRAEYYADFYRQYSTFMTDWFNSTALYRIASGPQSDDYRWTETLMKMIPLKLMEGIGLHHYSVIDWNHKGPAIEYSDHQYFQTMRKALFMEELIQRHGSIMDKYDPDRNVALVVDEWGTWYDPTPGTNPGFLHQQNTMRDALVAAVTLNIFNTHCSRVRMANLAQTVNVLQCVIMTEGEKILLTPTYHIMKMYRGHHDSLMVPIAFESPMIIADDGEIPALSVSASVNEKGEILVTIANIDIVNPHEILLQSDDALAILSSEILSAESVRTYNSFENPSKVTTRRFSVSMEEGMSFSIPPGAIVALRIR